MEIFLAVQLVYIFKNLVKRKLEKFVSNVIVVKNPIPDELIKPIDGKAITNSYINK